MGLPFLTSPSVLVCFLTPMEVDLTDLLVNTYIVADVWSLAGYYIIAKKIENLAQWIFPLELCAKFWYEHISPNFQLKQLNEFLEIFNALLNSNCTKKVYMNWVYGFFWDL